MSLILYYKASFANPLLLIGDERSKEDLPISDPRQTNDQVFAGRTIMGVRIRPASEGPAELHVWSGGERPSGVPAFEGTLDVASGRLWVGDFLLRHGGIIHVPAGPVDTTVILATPPYASRADVIVSSPSGEIPVVGS